MFQENREHAPVAVDNTRLLKYFYRILYNFSLFACSLLLKGLCVSHSSSDDPSAAPGKRFVNVLGSVHL